MRLTASLIRHAFLALTLLQLSLLGCATRTPVTSITSATSSYTVTSNPPGATVYRGTSPSNLTPYVNTPFNTHSAAPLGFSNQYFQARLEGYEPSQIFRQPMAAWGTPVRIHFELEPDRAALQRAEDQKALRAEAHAAEQDEMRRRKAQAAVTQLRQRQTCALVEENWVYVGAACRDGLAEGTGAAAHVDGQLEFVGTFRAGTRLEGILKVDGHELYEGPIANGRPHGNGICYYEDEPEECHYHRGKRVDVVYKQRVQFDRQLAELAKIRARMEDFETSAAATPVSQPTPVQPAARGAGDVLMDAAKRKAADQVMGTLFDALF